MDLGLAGRACAVTGASRGIGLATTKLLIAEGAHVLLVARGEDGLRAAVEACGGSAAPDSVATLALDVAAPDAGERIVGECVERWGGIWALVNNAGTSHLKPLDE